MRRKERLDSSLKWTANGGQLLHNENCFDTRFHIHTSVRLSTEKCLHSRMENSPEKSFCRAADLLVCTLTVLIRLCSVLSFLLGSCASQTELWMHAILWVCVESVEKVTLEAQFTQITILSSFTQYNVGWTRCDCITITFFFICGICLPFMFSLYLFIYFILFLSGILFTL